MAGLAIVVTAEPRPTLRLASPCVGTCRLDPGTGWCVGCGRDADELALWRELDLGRRAAIWAELPERLRRLGQHCSLLPWRPELALGCLAIAAGTPGAVLVMGVQGAVAELLAPPRRSMLTRQHRHTLELHTTGARARLLAHPGLRVFAGAGRFALALHRSRLEPTPAVITEFGPDHEAVREQDRGQPLVDLGLGRPGFRFAVRLVDPALLRLARRHLGRPLFGDAGELIANLIAAAPTRVLLTPLGRVEIEGPIDRADHAGPHSHLLTAHLAGDRPLATGLALPEAYAASALLLTAAEPGPPVIEQGDPPKP